MDGRGSAVVVGAGPGLGIALGRRFAAGGYPVALLARRPGALDLSAVPEAVPIAADAGDPRSLERALASAADQVGPVEVLLFNVSVPLHGQPSTVAPADLMAALAAGVVGAVTATQAVLPGMRARGTGTLLFTGGGTAVRPWVAAAAIGVQKAGVRNYALALAAELAAESSGVRAGTVRVDGMIGAPGFDPANIADAFWAWHTDPAAPAEVVYTG